jgi:hypothetical protein
MHVSYEASLSKIPSWTPGDRHPIALWAAPCKMNNQENDRDDQEHVNQAARDVEHKPTQDPCDEKHHKEYQKRRYEHGDLLFRLLRLAVMVAVGCVRAGLRIRERLAVQRRVGEHIRAVPFPVDLNDLVDSVGHLQGTSCGYRVATAGGNTK